MPNPYTLPMPYEQSLIQAGLTRDQAAVYETLVKQGPLPASLIPRRGGLQISRPLVYKVLEQLMEQGLVEKRDEPGKVAVFVPAHPLKLKELVERRLERAKEASTALSGVIDTLTSAFNLAGGKPGVQFFEGRSGVRKVAWDTLTTQGELLSYSDIEALRKHIPDMNAEYVAERRARGIRKRTLALDTAGSREYLKSSAPEITDLRLIKTGAVPFETSKHIYDGKVSYLTLSPDRMIGIIISDPHIYATEAAIFDFAWKQANELQPEDGSRSNTA